METFIKETLEAAGTKILTYFGSTDVLYSKNNVMDVVTEADLASNAIICDAIKAKYPEHGIMSEEGDGYQADSEYLWYVDPLDGTKNFSTHTPLFGINIALAYKGEIVMGGIYLPITKDFCYAEKGKGAFINGNPAACSGKEEWKGTYGLSTIKSSPENLAFLAEIQRLSDGKAWTNAIATSAVSGLWVSTGKRDWYIAPGKNAWDYAASALIAKEAGAIVTSFEGAEYKPGDRGLVVANSHLHPELLAAVQKGFLGR